MLPPGSCQGIYGVFVELVLNSAQDSGTGCVPCALLRFDDVVVVIKST